MNLLGGLSVQQGERIITRFQRQKTGALLAYLAYYLEQNHSREHLIETIWPDSSIGRNSLSVTLSSLRSQLVPPGQPADSILIADRFHVRLNPVGVTTDVAEFQKCLQRAERADGFAEKIQNLQGAAALYRGGLLTGHYDDWVQEQARYLEELYFRAVTELTTQLELTGDLSAGISVLRRAIAVDHLREEPHRQLMRLLSVSGQTRAALRHYEDLSKLLVDELGTEPEADTRDLAARLRREEQAGETGTPPSALEPPAGAVAGWPAEPVLLPAGTVTIALVEISQPRDTGQAPANILNATCKQLRLHGGHILTQTEDSLYAAFGNTGDALAFGIDSQRLTQHPGSRAGESSCLRMVLHIGQIRGADREQFTPLITQARPILAAAHAGQIVCTEPVAIMLRRDLEPGAGLRDLGVYRFPGLASAERLYMAFYPDMPEPEPLPLKAERAEGNHVPLSFNRFFGRIAEQTQLREWLVQPYTRLVTLTGTGGIGKTRLVLEVARSLVEQYSGAVWFVPLADLTDAALIPGAILDAVKRSRDPGRDPLDQVIEKLAAQPSLLAIDNYEHLVEHGAAVVRTLLEQVPSLRILVTSRQVLGLTGEREFMVQPFACPPAGDPAHLMTFPSIQLFLDRAQAVRPDFQLTAHNAPSVAALCEKLEGLPLAIELAAARASVLTPVQMLEKLSDRFALLTTNKRDRSARHQKMRAAIEWSYQLLDPDIRFFFDQLAVFRGGWSLDAAEQIFQDDLALEKLWLLRQCSLVQTEEAVGEIRFRMLETLREYAASQIVKEDGDVCAAHHADYYLALAERAVSQLEGPEQILWLDRMAHEHDNLRAGAYWAGEAGQNELFVRLALAHFPLLYRPGIWAEARRINEAAMEALVGLSCDARRHEAAIRWNRASLAQDRGELDYAREEVETSLALYRDIGDGERVADALILLGLIERDARQPDRAAECLKLVLETRPPSDHIRRGKACSNLALVARQMSDEAAANAYHEQALMHFRAGGDADGEARVLNNLGAFAEHGGDLVTAEPLFRQSLALYRRLGNVPRQGTLLSNLGKIAMLNGDFDTAVLYCYHAERILTGVGSALAKSPTAYLQQIREKVGQNALDALLRHAERTSV